MVRTPILSDDRDQMKEGARTQDATRHTVEANEIERARAQGLPREWSLAGRWRAGRNVRPVPHEGVRTQVGLSLDLSATHLTQL